MLKRGQLRHRVTVEHYVIGSPQTRPDGTPDGAWTTFATCWANVHPMSARALFAAAQEHAEAKVQIDLDYLADVTAAMRVRFGGKVYRILGIIDWEERHREMQFICSEGLDG